MNELIVISIIQCAIISIPWGAYILSSNKEIGFFDWIDQQNISKPEFLFLALCLYGCF